MQMYKILDLCGPHCVSIEEGEKVRKIIVENLSNGKTIELDFDGVQTLTSSFLNSAIGRLYGEFEKSKIENAIKVKGLDKSDGALMAIVIKNAIEFYAKDPKAREAAKDVIKDLKEDS